jgi:PAS domain S-box-containing protein
MIRIPRAALVVFAVLYASLYLAWLLAAPAPPEAGGPHPLAFERLLAGALAMVFTGMVSAWLAYQARSTVGNLALRSTWTWLSIGLSIWVAGDLLRLAASLAFPSWHFTSNLLDLIYLLGSVGILIALFRYPQRRHLPVGKLRLFTDIAITATSLVSLAWLIVLKPVMDVIQTSHGSPAAILYPSADLILLLALLILFLYNEPRAFPAPFAWIALGLAAYATSDLAYAYLLIGASYQPGSLVDFGWTVGDGLMILAAAKQLSLANRPYLEPDKRSLAERAARRIQTLLPLVSTIALGWYTILAFRITGSLDPLGLWGTVVLGLGLIGRQGILVGEYEFQQYARLVNSIAEPIFISNRAGELRMVNPALLEIAGYTQAESLLGLPLQQLIRPAQEVKRMIEQGLAGGFSGEVGLRRSDGALVPVMLALRPVMWSGREQIALAGAAHDLSETKRQQTALQHAYEEIAQAHTELGKTNLLLEQRVAERTASLSEAYQQLEHQNVALQQLDQLKSDFVSLVSHELRAPLTNISGGIELLMVRTRSLSAQARQTLALVQGEILRLTRFIEAILDLSALDAGRAPIYPAPLRLSSAVHAIQRQMTHLAGADRIHWQIPEDYPELLADEHALVSILYHLLDNAMKYAPQGEITLTAGVEDSMGWIRVEDEGDGIPEEDIPMLFSRFFRSHAGDSQVTYGHGLGLYIVLRLLEAMNGKIEAANRSAGGACFTCWLPLVQEEETGEENELENFAG